MIRLYHSNRTERLLEALVENLDGFRRRPGASLFDPIAIVVPNRNLERYLKFGLARRHGIAAHLKVGFLLDLLARAVEHAAGAERPTRLIDGAVFQGLLLSLFHDEALLAEAELAPVRQYLLAVGDRPDAVDLRRCQLATQLARLFDEYSVSRFEMVAAWHRGTAIAEPQFQTAERWQRRLWLEIFGTGGLVERRERASGIRWRTLPDAFTSLDSAPLALPPALHLFGLSSVARVYQRIFRALGRGTELHLYSLNPCLEFWEDVASDAEVRRRARPSSSPAQLVLEFGDSLAATEDDPFSVEAPADTPALRLWGRPGREHIRLLNELVDGDFDARWGEPLDGGPTLLHRLQSDILHRQAERSAPPAIEEAAEADGSIQLHACAGVRRELETIAAEIWSLVRTDDERATPGGLPLRMSDIAVVLPAARQEVYLAHLAAVFHETHGIPYNVVDLPLSAESRVVEALQLLLGLPFSEYRRQELLRLVVHPSVLARFPDADAGDAERWVGWCDALGIFHGADHHDHEGTYIERDLVNWDQGLKRLALGVFLTGAEHGVARPIELDGRLYLPEEVPQGSASSAMRFALLVRSLIADARFAAGAHLTLPEWADFFAALVTSYLGADDDVEERVLGRCKGALQDLAAVDLDGRAVSYRVAHELARSAVAGLTGGRGQLLADGVVVSTLAPLRALPFRAIFLCGLGEGDFPSPDRKNPLDLRLARRMTGDISPRERDRYQFLEAILCARDRLYLSYVARDALTGDPLEPSSVVRELCDLVERQYLPPVEKPPGFHPSGSRLLRRHPLRRYDEEDLRFAAPEARRERQARRLGEDLRAALGPAAPAVELGDLRERLAPSVWEPLAQRLGLCQVGPPAPREETEVETVTVSMAAIRRFLECPLQGSARFLLGLRDDEESDLLALEDERFATSRLVQLQLLRDVLTAHLGPRAVGLLLEQLYDERAALLELKGLLPTGVFAEAERARHLATLHTWRGQVDTIARGRPLQPRISRFGAADEHALVDQLLAPLVLDQGEAARPGSPRRVRVEISGRTELMLDRVGEILLVERRVLPGIDERVRTRKETLRAFLDHAMLSAAAVSDGAPLDAHVCIAAPRHSYPFHAVFAPFDATEARAYLGSLVTDMLAGVHSYLLPCEAVLGQHERGGSLADSVIALVDGRSSFSSRFGPVRHPERYAPPPEAEGLAIVERRFGPYFARFRAVDDAGEAG